MPRNVRPIVIIAFSLCALLAAAPTRGLAQEQNRSIPPADLDAKDRTQVLVMATQHLQIFGDDFDRSSLEKLLAVLQRYAPDLIGVEKIQPTSIRAMQSRPEDYNDVIQYFAENIVTRGDAMQQALNLSWTEARAQALETLNGLECATDEAAARALRIKAIPLLLAEYDYCTALLQWRLLSTEDRVAAPNLSDEVRAELDKALQGSNEVVSIGVELAARLGLQQIYPIDDHNDKDLLSPISDQLNKELMASEIGKTQPWKQFYEDIAARQQSAYKAGDLLPFYLYINSAEYGGGDIANQWQAFFHAKLPSGYDRARVALWEVRNLDIASNIRRATALHPGAKMLVIIGASHKAFLDAYLKEMMDVEIVQLSDIAER